MIFAFAEGGCKLCIRDMGKYLEQDPLGHSQTMLECFYVSFCGAAT